MAAIYSTTVTLADANYPVDPQLEIPFEPRSILLIHRGTTDNVTVSFDGVNDHGELIPTLMQSVRFSQRLRKVWLKSAAAPSVRIVAE